MLKGIDPLLSPELLAVIAEMGHGDELAVVDGNFPAAAMARRLVRVTASAPSVLRAILTLFPLDDFVDSPVTVMEVVGAPDETPEPVREFRQAADAAESRHIKMSRIDRFSFYERSKNALAIAATSEHRLYGCVLVRKSVVRPR